MAFAVNRESALPELSPNLYVLPRSIQSFWKIDRRRGLSNCIPLARTPPIPSRED